jgi:hypothetical protein
MVAVGNRPHGLAVAGGLVRVGAHSYGASHRGGTLTVLQNAPFGPSDPMTLGISEPAFRADGRMLDRVSARSNGHLAA